MFQIFNYLTPVSEITSSNICIYKPPFAIQMPANFKKSKFYFNLNYQDQAFKYKTCKIYQYETCKN